MKDLVGFGLGLGLLGLSLVGCKETTCGTGTYDVDGECVPTLAPACGFATKLEGGLCVPDPGAPQLTCAGGTLQLGQECRATVLRAGNASFWTNVQVTAPAAFGTAYNTRLMTAYGADDVQVGMQFIASSADGAGRIIGGARVDSGIDAAYTLTSGTIFELTLASGEAEEVPGTLVVALFDGASLPLTEVTVTDTSVELIDGVSLVRAFTFSGVLLPADAALAMIDGMTVAAILDDLGVPFDVDTDGDTTNDAWRLTGTVAADAEGWVL